MAKFLTLAQMQTVFADAMRSIREVMVKEIYEPVKAVADQAKAIADGVRRDADAGKFDGEKGDTGDAAKILSKSVTYQVGDSGSIIPSGSWDISIPVAPQGKYLWTKTEIQFNSGEPVVSYVSARQGMDGSGSGSIVSVNDVRPNEAGNIALTADDVGALPAAGGDMTGGINMNGQSISGLNDPTEGSQAARKGYVDAAKAEANAYTDTAKAEANAYTDTAKTEANAYTDTAKTEANAYTDAAARKAAPRNLLDNSNFTNLVAQAGIGGNHGTIAYAADRWILDSGTVSYEAGVGMTLNGTIRQKLEFPPAGETSAFVGMASGEASISYADGAVTITSGGGVLKWSALYGGVYSASTMPEYQPKGYGAELAECQRYYRIFSHASSTIICTLHAYSASKAMGLINFNSIMRTIPQMHIVSGGFRYYTTAATECTAEFNNNTKSSVRVFAEGSFTTGAVATLQASSSGLVYEAIADL